MEEIIRRIEEYCTKEAIEHRFVGGISWGGLLNEETEYSIDIPQRTIQLYKHTQLNHIREDGSAKDIDLIYFCSDQAKIENFKKFLHETEDWIQTTYHSLTLISVENAQYESPNTLMQFVTSIICSDKVYGEGTVSLMLGSIVQPISWNSLEAWKVVLEDGFSYTARNPIADYFAYQFRSASGPKPKDEHKLSLLKKLVEQVIELSQHEAIDFMSDQYYRPWKQYVETLQTINNFDIRLKRTITKIYWNTIGTFLAHGKGPFGKLLLKFSNQFTGGAQ